MLTPFEYGISCKHENKNSLSSLPVNSNGIDPTDIMPQLNS